MRGPQAIRWKSHVSPEDQRGHPQCGGDSREHDLGRDPSGSAALDPVLSRMAVHRLTEGSWEDYGAFTRRVLPCFGVVYLFLDTVRESLRRQGGGRNTGPCLCPHTPLQSRQPLARCGRRRRATSSHMALATLPLQHGPLDAECASRPQSPQSPDPHALPIKSVNAQEEPAHENHRRQDHCSQTP